MAKTRTTYAQPAGTNTGRRFFQGVEISPATIADGSLFKHLDTVRYPQEGTELKNDATVVLTVSPASPQTAATTVTLTATVSGVSPVATGTVTFKDGATTKGTGTLNGSGVATLTTTLAAGVHSLTAVYAGDAETAAETSAAVRYVTTSAAPTVTSITPTTGSVDGGTSVTLTGTNLDGATGVTVGGSAATSVVVVSATQITFVTPAHASGAAAVVVSNPSGASGAATSFTYA